MEIKDIGRLIELEGELRSLVTDKDCAALRGIKEEIDNSLMQESKDVLDVVNELQSKTASDDTVIELSKRALQLRNLLTYRLRQKGDNK